MSIQLDYGGFEPTFIGITANISTRNALDYWLSEHFAGLQVDLASLTTDARFEYLCTASTLAHELRHFHDFLISPYSARVFKHRVEIAVMASELIDDLVFWSQTMGFAMIAVDHQAEVLRRLCPQRGVVLEEGKIVQEGSWEELVREPATPLLRSLLAPL